MNLVVGLGLLTYLAMKLARNTGRDKVTALPYGISTPIMFVYLFGIIGPVFFATQDPLLGYRLALGAAFIGGLMQMSGALIGPWLARITPQAGMVGTIAGVAIVWVAMVPSAILLNNPVIGLLSLFVLLVALVGLIHAEQIGLSLSPMTLGYLLLVALFGFLHFSGTPQEEVAE